MARRMILVPADSPTTEKPKICELVDMLPKSYHSKATILLNAIDGKIQLDKNNRVVYNNGETGSHIIDLVKYMFSPKFSKMTRPSDIKVFVRTLREIGVPTYLLDRVTVNNNDNNDWMRYNANKH